MTMVPAHVQNLSKPTLSQLAAFYSGGGGGGGCSFNNSAAADVLMTTRSLPDHGYAYGGYDLTPNNTTNNSPTATTMTPTNSEAPSNNNHNHNNNNNGSLLGSDLLGITGPNNNNNNMEADEEHSRTSNSVNEAASSSSNKLDIFPSSAQAPCQSQSQDQQHSQTQAGAWLQLGLGGSHDQHLIMTTTPPHHHHHHDGEESAISSSMGPQMGGRSFSTGNINPELMLELNLGSGAVSSSDSLQTTPLQQPSPIAAANYGMPLGLGSGATFLSPPLQVPPDHNNNQMGLGMGWGFNIRPGLRLTSSSPSPSSFIAGSMMSSSSLMGPFLGRPFTAAAGGLLEGVGPSSDIRIIDPPPRRPHSGIWFMLQASQPQAREPYLPQLPKSFLRIKDGRMTVRLVKKYVANKLGLDSESEVEIRCRGQQLIPYLTLQHVRDNIWSSRDAVTLLPDSSTSDHVMVLHYGRS